jgi:hypothetical protein
MAQPSLMLAEAENNLILGIARGIVRNSAAASSRHRERLTAFWPAARIPPFKVVTCANREPIAELRGRL